LFVLATFIVMSTTPVVGSIGNLSNKSFVRLVYKSILPETLPFHNTKSVPQFSFPTSSYLNSGLGEFVTDATGTGTCVDAALLEKNKVVNALIELSTFPLNP